MPAPDVQQDARPDRPEGDVTTHSDRHDLDNHARPIARSRSDGDFDDDSSANPKRQRLHCLVSWDPNAQMDGHSPSSGSKTLSPISDDDGLYDLLLIDSGEQYTTLGPEICEIYSPPRIVPVGKGKGFREGWSLDLSTCDREGRPWDFGEAACRNRAKQLVNDTKPLLLVLSPMCRFFSQLQNLSKNSRDQETFETARLRYNTRISVLNFASFRKIQDATISWNNRQAPVPGKNLRCWSSWKIPVRPFFVQEICVSSVSCLKLILAKYFQRESLPDG